jgi:hypothetical protein
MADLIHRTFKMRDDDCRAEIFAANFDTAPNMSALQTAETYSRSRQIESCAAACSACN